MSNINILTSRFNNETWLDNVSYRTKNKHGGCIYGTPLQISAKIPLNSFVFIVEMNNSTNKIEGIGLVKNMVQFDKYYSIYQIGNYNRYIYKGDYRIDRTTIESLNPRILSIFDHILFKEKTHLKRGSGLTLIPKKLLKHRICDDINLENEMRILFYNNFKNCKEI